MKRIAAICGITCAVLLVLFFCVSAVSAFIPAFGGSSSFWGRAGTIWRILVFTVKQAFFSTLTALAIGLPAAYFTACRRFPGRRFLEALSSVSLCVPPLLIALGYVIFFGMNGIFNRTFMTVFSLKEPPFTLLYSFYGIVLVHGFYNFPIIMRTVGDAWKNLPEDEYNAALLSGAGRFRIFRTVTLYQLLPSMAAGSVIVFLYCFFSFIIVLLFGQAGCTTLEVEVYQTARNTLDFAYAGQLALTETLVASGFVVVYMLLGKKGSRTRTSLRTMQPSSVKGGAEHAGLFLVLGLILLFLIFPLGAIAFSGWGEFTKLFRQGAFRTSLQNTVVTAFSSSSICVVTAFVFACFARKADPEGKRTLFRVIPILPMAVSSVVIGFGIGNILQFFRLPRNAFLLVVCQGSVTWPFAYQQIRGAMDRIPQSVTDSARLLSRSPLDVVFRILIPQTRRGLFSAFAFCAAISAGDASLPLVLGISRFETLALYTYRLAGAYRFKTACAAGTVLIAASMLLTAIAGWLSEEKCRVSGAGNKEAE